jgi:hypothetical protein
MYSIAYSGGWLSKDGVLKINNRGWCKGCTLEEAISECIKKVNEKQSQAYKYEFEKARLEKDVLTKESVEKLIYQT